MINNSSYEEVCENISNLQNAIKNNNLDTLKEYYKDEKEYGKSFLEYLSEETGESIENITSPNYISEWLKGECDLFEALKNSYKVLFSIQDQINRFKESSKDKMKEME